MKHAVTHHIKIHGPLAAARPLRLQRDRSMVVKRESQHMLDLGIIRPFSSTCSSPIYWVPKKSWTDWRVSGDYRSLNNWTVPDASPVPLLHDFSCWLRAHIFSKSNSLQAYNQIHIEPADIPKTAVIISFGMFEFLRIPFGLHNAAQTSQNFIDTLTRGFVFRLCVHGRPTSGQ